MRGIIIAGLAAVLGGGSAVALSACSDDDVLANDDEGQVNVSLIERDLKPGRAEVSDGKPPSKCTTTATGCTRSPWRSRTAS